MIASRAHHIAVHHTHHLTALSYTAYTAGGGLMQTLDDPPPPLAADVAINIMQAKLAAENLCVASSNILDLIRTLRLSALLMDEEAIRAEEKEEALKVCEMGLQAEEECAALEAKLIELRNNESLGR
eukprot:scaffold529_cov196-Alexandrium_tamarense.AAC.22